VTRLRTTATLLGLLLLPTACAVVAGLGDPKVLAVAPDVQAVSISMGGAHGCAVVQGSEGSPENGTVRCWGDNSEGQLGNDPAVVPSSARPVVVELAGDPAFGAQMTMSPASSLALATGYSCAITADSYFFCWGTIPQVSAAGIHPAEASPPFEPSQMNLRNSPLIRVTTGAVGDNGGCLLSDNALVCWGAAAFSTPQCGLSGISCDAGGVAMGNDSFASMSVGANHVCAIASRAGVTDVECWGANDHGQAGDGPMNVSYPSPVGVNGYGTIVQVASGGNHSCALVANGTNGSVYCWGQNDRGQLGDPTNTNDSSTPVAVEFTTEATGGKPSAVEIAVGIDHACAIMSDQSTQCWGDDSMGQLGIGATTGYEAKPVSVQRVVQEAGALPRGNHIAAGGDTTCEIRWGDPQVWCWGANGSGQAGQPPEEGQDGGAAVVAYATPMAW
jgi:alpha-tubulin suppressor-like RCC1 family protein